MLQREVSGTSDKFASLVILSGGRSRSEGSPISRDQRDVSLPGTLRVQHDKPKVYCSDRMHQLIQQRTQKTAALIAASSISIH
jgi:hypothetical protein